MKRTFLPFLCLILVACVVFQPAPLPTPTAGVPYEIKQEENPYAPKTEDLSLREESVILTSVNFSERYDMSPIRAELHVLGSMPSVCSELRIKVNPPNAEYQISIEVYSVSDPKSNCENVFQQFEVSILLGEYSAGQYTVWVNDNLAGSIASY